ncbi:MAG: aspartyl/asparaginyl beta-hydroxylase domain-containing protein [Xenococcaceae cyanobacterium MO_188.B32]|nr:aspartyl/asparaginyl beta-hydroxylase domain-containing protein [Xenococcaceae cyanobacterium MO_188.B32]
MKFVTKNKFIRKKAVEKQINKANSNTALEKQQSMSAIIKILIRVFAKAFSRYSLVANTTFLDIQEFSWIADLESNWVKIRQELDLILNNIDAIPNFQEISKEQYSITQDNLWKTYFFYAYGVKAEKNCERCPETTCLIEKIPGIKTAFFSILLPHKHIPEHRGPYKGVLRYHLGLIIPQPENSCKIRVGNDILHWKEGKSLVFDDTYPHEVWNKSNNIRVVLLIDFVRPMYFPFSLINRFLIQLISWSPFVQDAKKRQNEWDEYLETSK